MIICNNDNNNDNDKNKVSPSLTFASPSLTFVSPSLTFDSPSLIFEVAGCLKKLPATSKGGHPHSDIVSDIKAYQTISRRNSVEISGAIASLL